MDTLNAIEERHSVREFTSDPIPRDMLVKLCDAATMAPSAMNEQPWKFYVTSGESRRRLGEIVAQSTVHLQEYVDVMSPEHYEAALQWYSALGNAPVVIVVTSPDAPDEFWRMNRFLSVGAAIQNLLLAATDFGLGTCSITFTYHSKAEIAAELGIPEGESMVSIIAVGYPSDTPQESPPHERDVAVYLD